MEKELFELWANEKRKQWGVFSNVTEDDEKSMLQNGWNVVLRKVEAEDEARRQGARQFPEWTES